MGKKTTKPAPRRIVEELKTVRSRSLQDSYLVDGVRYIREELVQSKMESIMERIAVAQEEQLKLYQWVHKRMEPMMKIIEMNIKRMPKFKDDNIN